MFDTAKFGAFVANLRKKADMTQSELGDRLGLTRQAISRYECGESFPDISILGELSSILDVPLEVLVRSGEPTEGEARIIEAVSEQRDITPSSADDVVSLAPLLKPSVLKKLSESLARQGLGMSAILSLAEYLNDTDTEKLMQLADFDTLADADPMLLEKLLPLLGPYAPDVIFGKIIEGELDYRYLELLGSYSSSSIEAAVVYGMIDADALNIMRRNNYNSARMKRRGVIRLFTCPECGSPLAHFHPRRCKCGYQPPMLENVLRLAKPDESTELSSAPLDCERLNRSYGDELLILVLGAASLPELIGFCYGSPNREFVILDDDEARLVVAERSVHSKNYAQLLFALDDLRTPHLVPGSFDLVIDNTACRLGDTEAIRALLKQGGSVVFGR